MFIHAIASQAPAYSFTQDYARDAISSWYEDRYTRRKIRALARASGIASRGSVLPFDDSRADPFRRDGQGRPRMPGTQERNRLFIAHAPELGQPAVEAALAQAGFAPGEVTHLITVSCTGFSNPGLDFELVTRMGMADGVERYNLGFMGCYASIPALRMAQQFTRADPEAVVAICAVELCTLHLQNDDSDDTLLGNTLFADGAAACIVSGQPARRGQARMRLDGFRTALVTQGRGDMAWEISDQGFTMVLSSYIPELLSSNLDRILDRATGGDGRGVRDAAHWAIHPGGKMILDKAEKGLSRAGEAGDGEGIEGVEDAPGSGKADLLAPSRAVLRDYGNMSSATILYVLARMLEEGRTGSICAMAFGPGLTVEMATGALIAAQVDRPGADGPGADRPEDGETAAAGGAAVAAGLAAE